MPGPPPARGWRLPDVGPGAAVVVLGLLSAITWGTGDFGGGLLSRRAPLFGIVAVSQVVGMVSALALAILRGEPFPSPPDIGWAIGAGVFGMGGMTMLYHGLAVGRMGVVAPVTGVVGAVIPVVFGFALEGVPPPIAIVGILVALVAVVLVTRAPGHQADHPSGIRWALGAGIAIGGFNLCIGGLSAEAAFGPLAIVRALQTLLLVSVIVAWRQPWRVPRGMLGKITGIGLLDMTGNAAFIMAAQVGQLAIAAVLASLYPVVTVLLAITILRERLSRSHIAGVALAGVAIAMIAAGTSAT